MKMFITGSSKHIKAEIKGKRVVISAEVYVIVLFTSGI